MVWLHTLRRKARSWASLPFFEKVWFAPVWLLLGLSRLALRMIEFRRLAPLLGQHARNVVVIPLVTESQCARARRIGRVVRLAARYTPWVSNCLPQAVTARLLLGLYRVPYAFYFGLAKDGGEHSPLRAHAWICAGPVAATGGNSFREFTVVSTFVSPALYPDSMC